MMDLPIAAVLYAPGDPVHEVLKAFVARLQGDGVDIHGVLQDPAPERGIDAVDIHTGRRTPILRPTDYELDNKVCSLKPSKLTEAGASLRRALDGGAELVVVEKFGKSEKDGEGLADDLLAVMAEGIPTVVSVPVADREAWSAFTGGMGVAVTCEAEALMAWWRRVRP
ncbi:MAG: DUF2478 domain-containing protein [Alphaproteobacteria bacterium]|nr:DUF2478 domain-containing protein [Alphaproteobacteria bacterium]